MLLKKILGINELTPEQKKALDRQIATNFLAELFWQANQVEGYGTSIALNSRESQKIIDRLSISSTGMFITGHYGLQGVSDLRTIRIMRYVPHGDIGIQRVLSNPNEKGIKDETETVCHLCNVQDVDEKIFISNNGSYTTIKGFQPYASSNLYFTIPLELFKAQRDPNTRTFRF